MRDYYSILGITPNASEADIKAAFRQLSHKYHPDKNGGKRFYEEKFKSILEAYAVLSDAVRRKEYDEAFHQYRATGLSTADLRRFEEALAWQFEEDLRKREEEIRRVYGISATEVLYRAPPLVESVEEEQTDMVKRWLVAGLVMALLVLAALMLGEQQPAGAKKPASPANVQAK